MELRLSYESGPLGGAIELMTSDIVLSAATRQASVLKRPGSWNRRGRHLAEDDHAEHFILGDVGRASAADHLSVLHHHHAVRQVEHVVDVVADQEDPDALCL